MSSTSSTRWLGWRRSAALVLAAASLLLLAWKPESARDRAVELLAELSHPAERETPSRSRDISVPGPTGSLKARLYAPSGTILRRAIVVAHGVHRRGIDEPRLVRFASDLSRVGFTVLTPELSALARYRIDASSIDDIAASVAYLSKRADLAPTGRVGLFGISFGGGLALVAAEDPDVGKRLEYVASVGGHHDLYRVLRFFLTNEIETPKGIRKLKAHEYGAALLVLDQLDALAPAQDREVLERSFRAFIAEDRELARREAAKLSTRKGRELFDKLEHNCLSELAPVILPLLDKSRPRFDRLSPRGRMSRISVPVFLLHGQTDRVIPPSELAWAAAELENRPHRALVTSLIEHVTPDRPAGLFEKLALVEFMAEML